MWNRGAGTPPWLAWWPHCWGGIKAGSQNNLNQRHSKTQVFEVLHKYLYKEIFFWSPLVHANESNQSFNYMRFMGKIISFRMARLLERMGKEWSSLSSLILNWDVRSSRTHTRPTWRWHGLCLEVRAKTGMTCSSSNVCTESVNSSFLAVRTWMCGEGTL